MDDLINNCLFNNDDDDILAAAAIAQAIPPVMSSYTVVVGCAFDPEPNHGDHTGEQNRRRHFDHKLTIKSRRTMHMANKITWMRELNEEGNLEGVWVSKTEMFSDILTKNVGGSDYDWHKKQYIGWRECRASHDDVDNSARAYLELVTQWIATKRLMILVVYYI